MNCANCAVATDATLSGAPASALTGQVTSQADLSKYFKKPAGSWIAIEDTSDGIKATVAKWGPNARAIVFGDRGEEQIGHFFNVANQRGKVRFFDGQIGKAPKNLSQYKRFEILRTDR
jgi:hypothetical protein